MYRWSVVRLTVVQTAIQHPKGSIAGCHTELFNETKIAGDSVNRPKEIKGALLDPVKGKRKVW